MTHPGSHSLSAIVVMVERGQAFRREAACGAEGQGWLGWGERSWGTFAEGWERVNDVRTEARPPASDFPAALPLPGWGRRSPQLAQDTGGDKACHS